MAKPAAKLADHFWKKPLEEMTNNEWEALCDGCAKCCMHKLIDDDTDELYFTNVVCDLLDSKRCSCTDYPNRLQRVPDCIKITTRNYDDYAWFPITCTYRRLLEGKGLPEWHPILTGSKAAMHKAGMSARGKVVHESFVDDLQEHIVTWPMDDCI